jgi:hypothetical protein
MRAPSVTGRRQRKRKSDTVAIRHDGHDIPGPEERDLLRRRHSQRPTRNLYQVKNGAPRVERHTLQHVDVAFECMLEPQVANTGEVGSSAVYMNLLDKTGDLPPFKWKKYAIRAGVRSRPRRMSDHATRRRLIRVSSSPWEETGTHRDSSKSPGLEASLDGLRHLVHLTTSR